MVYTKKIAKTVIGREFLHSRSNAFYVSAAGAKDICKTMNEVRFGLKDGECWYVYDVQYGDDMYLDRVVKRRNGRVWITSI